ncbi:phosphatidylglycerol lysyltransferase domain-containing protein, partial [Psychrobacter sp.]|uniref:phosphatidylglycerol lysyltransferase domain-containing protein n=1 Tax=Psychrobacter sp. TaxID=56811 RepID=UPI0025F850EB
VLAVTLGIISHVPAGLGVFELTMVTSLPKVDKTTLLSVLLLFRILYYIIPFLLGILSFILHEAYIRSGKNAYHQLHLKNEPTVPEILTNCDTQPPHISAIDWLPQLMALIIAIVGLLMLIVSILPPNQDRELLLNELLPFSIVEASYLLNTLMGFALIVLARGLYQRLNGAWLLTMWLLGLSSVTLLIKHLEYETACLAILAFMVLYVKKDIFNRQSSLMSLRLNLPNLSLLSILFISLFWVGMFVHRHEPYTASLWWDTTGDSGARFMRSYAVLTIFSISYVMFSLIRFKKPKPVKASFDDLLKAEKVIKMSTKAIANLSLLGDKQLLFSNTGNSFIMYQVHGRSWIAMSDPIGDESEFFELINKFIALAQGFGGAYVFYEVSNRYGYLLNKNGIQLLKIGEEAIVDLDKYSLQGSKNAKYRQTISRGNKDGLTFEVVPPEQVANILGELKVISDIWLNDKGSVEKGFSLGYFDENYLKHFDCAIIKYNNTIVAFSNIWKSGGLHELSVDLMRYRVVYNEEGKEIKSIMDYLFVNLFVWGKEQGYHNFSLGGAPFTGIVPSNLCSNVPNPVLNNSPSNSIKNTSSTSSSKAPINSNASNEVKTASFDSHKLINTTTNLNTVNLYNPTGMDVGTGRTWRFVTQTVTKYGKDYYNFEGLRQFKEKYHPRWEPRYIGIETGLRAGIKPIQGLTDTTLLISGGLSSFIKK